MLGNNVEGAAAGSQLPAEVKTFDFKNCEYLPFFILPNSNISAKYLKNKRYHNNATYWDRIP